MPVVHDLVHSRRFGDLDPNEPTLATYHPILCKYWLDSEQGPGSPDLTVIWPLLDTGNARVSTALPYFQVDISAIRDRVSEELRAREKDMNASQDDLTVLMRLFESGSPEDRVRLFWWAYLMTVDADTKRPRAAGDSASSRSRHQQQQRLGASSKGVSMNSRHGHGHGGNTSAAVTSASDKNHPGAIFLSALYAPELSTIANVILLRHIPGFSVAEFARILAHSKENVHSILQSIVGNNPRVLTEVFRGFMNGMTGRGGDDVFRTAVMGIGEMSPAFPRKLRSVLVERGMHADLILALTLLAPDRPTLFLASMLGPHGGWFWERLHAQTSTMGVAALGRVLQLQAERLTEIKTGIASRTAKPSDLTELVHLLRLYCAFVGIAMVTLSTQEIVEVLSLLCLVDEPRILECGLAFILLCRNLTAIPRTDGDLLVTCLEHILKSRARDALLLVAIRVHVNRLTLVHDSVASLARLRGFAFDTKSMNKMRHAIMELLPEGKLTEMILNSGPTPCLSTRTPSASINSIHPLLRERVCVRLKMDAGKWLIQQIACMAAPVHRLAGAVISAFVDCTVPTGTDSVWTMEPLAETELRAILEQGHKTGFAVPQVLAVYYVLQFIQRTARDKVYSEDFITKLPVREVLQVLNENPTDYANIAPPLVGLAVLESPSLFTVTAILRAADAESAPAVPSYVDSLNLGAITRAEVERAFAGPLDDTNTAAPLAVKRLQCLDASALARDHYETVFRVLERARACLPNVSYSLQKEILKVWRTLSQALAPAVVIELTINALRGGTSEEPLSYADIRDDCLGIVHLIQDIASCPPLVQIALEVLELVLPATHRVIVSGLPVFGTEQLLPVLESAIVQGLFDVLVHHCVDEDDLEVLLVDQAEIITTQSGDRTPPLSSATRDEITAMICKFVHGRFVKYGVNLIKLIHFQTYPTALLPITVGQIPSMHVCLSFVPELLSQLRPECKVFAVRLGGALIEKFPLPQSVGLAKLLISCARGVADTESSDPRLRLACVPMLAHIVKALPNTADEILNLLFRYHEIGSSAVVTGGDSQLCRAVENAFRWIVDRVIVKADTSERCRSLGIRV